MTKIRLLNWQVQYIIWGPKSKRIKRAACNHFKVFIVNGTTYISAGKTEERLKNGRFQDLMKPYVCGWWLSSCSHIHGQGGEFISFHRKSIQFRETFQFCESGNIPLSLYEPFVFHAGFFQKSPLPMGNYASLSHMLKCWTSFFIPWPSILISLKLCS